MTHPLTPREKVELKPCPFCGGETISTHSQDMTEGPAYFWHKCETCGAETEGDYGEAEAASMWNRRTALASGSGDQSSDATNMVDHAGLARLAQTAIEAVALGDGLPEAALTRFHTAANPATVRALIAEVAALRGERDQIAGESIWWKGVIGDGSHQPSGEVRSIKHLHPAMVKPIYEAHKGTAVADVIAGLVFSLAINQNREQFLVAHANDRATEAERKLAEAVGHGRKLLYLVDGGPSTGTDVHSWAEAARAFLNKEAERG